MKILNPARERYDSRPKNNKGCILCNAAKIKKQTIKNMETGYWRVWVNKYPYMDGNLMAVPKRHLSRVSQLNEEEWRELHGIIVKAKKTLVKIFKTNSFNIGLNIGKGAGASIRHMHWQILPRTSYTHGINDIFADLHVIKTSPTKLKSMIEKIKI